MSEPTKKPEQKPEKEKKPAPEKKPEKYVHWVQRPRPLKK